MRINIKNTNIVLTLELSDYLNKRLASFEKLLSHQSEVAIVDVEVGRTTRHHHTGDIYRAEINIHIGHKSFRSVQETQDLHTSIDAAKDQMLEELRSNKEKHFSLVRRGSQKVKAFIKGMRWWGKDRG